MTASFAEFGLAAPLARAVDAAGYVTPTPIQAGAIPHLIAGKDLLGLAQTGTGKTAAFVLPILQALRSAGSRPEPYTARALILAPTRELAIQIHDTVKVLSKGQHFAHASVFGGVSINPQIDALRRGLDILIATPGRLVDLLNQKQCKLSSIRHFVLDEADRMLDMGFIRDIRRIVALLPKERQSMLFSATMPETIAEIAGSLLIDPVTVEVRAEAVPVDRITQKLVHLPVAAKKEALLKLLSARDVTRAMVFARTKHGANRLNDYLVDYGLKAVVIHGNKSQGARQKALGEFKSGEATILVATDIAARGIDVADVSHVINAELPDEPESYVHRIGRTARAGRYGVAITLCAPEEKDKLKAVERLIRRALDPMLIEGIDLKQAAASGERISEERRPSSRPARGRQGRGGQSASGPSRDGQPSRQRPARAAATGADSRQRNRDGERFEQDAPRAERPVRSPRREPRQEYRQDQTRDQRQDQRQDQRHDQRQEPRHAPRQDQRADQRRAEGDVARPARPAPRRDDQRRRDERPQGDFRRQDGRREDGRRDDRGRDDRGFAEPRREARAPVRPDSRFEARGDSRPHTGSGNGLPRFIRDGSGAARKGRR
jgi:ATP-dependent RNA helicase RhlE